MMLYCENCMLLCGDGACPNCGAMELRPPKENDSVYLTTKDIIWSGTVEDILAKNNIPHLKQGLLGAGVAAKVGYGSESYQFFVPFGAFEKSKELLAEIFPE